MKVPLDQCPTCRQGPSAILIPIEAGHPARVTMFRELTSWRNDCSLYTVFQCPICSACYRHEYYYDSGGGVGPSFESQELVLLTVDETRRLLIEHGGWEFDEQG